MAKASDLRTKILEMAAPVGDALDADVFLFAGSLEFGEAKKFCKMVRKHRRRDNVMLMACTFGGSADAAYMMARCLQEIYATGKLIMFVPTFCKSAGTLLVLAANELVMSDDSQLGPLDVQLRKPDEIDERTSGLTAIQALITLRDEAYASFEHFFVNLRRRTKITSRTAAEIASTLTSGLFSPIYEQLEPMRLGENDRAMQVGQEYGKRIAEPSNNLQPNALEALIAEYPSHEFIIDRREAKKLFRRVRKPTEAEATLADALEPICEMTLYDDEREALIDYLTPPVPAPSPTPDSGSDSNEQNEQNEDIVASNGNQNLPESPNEAGGEDGTPEAIESGGNGQAAVTVA